MRESAESLVVALLPGRVVERWRVALSSWMVARWRPVLCGRAVTPRSSVERAALGIIGAGIPEFGAVALDGAGVGFPELGPVAPDSAGVGPAIHAVPGTERFGRVVPPAPGMVGVGEAFTGRAGAVRVTLA
ncbi:hypothetical protein AMIS_53230 [Actinoplanes missouriensis 431]|uniref:Uncharacterized protein n=1 Tax=Actinoplanes missouriensis (strain ATCC 14538 / DSM 43046 / CBS 188.64 / JCM 3121 / NBRC 102363 / NCIMB 12654 / NRRL B-3342 / UNCC 431) TaxID=512565 RepID=I0HC06_ACTM4|nr:hypothetical protein AMIS_53230 [Actinoplanes missouriensis 431]